jgi:SRSO17 transposase
VLKGRFHFRTVYIWDKNINSVEERLLVVSSRKTKDGEEIKYSFTNANLAQYTEQVIAYMQAQRFFIEHSFKEQKQILGLDQFQTRKWLSWYHQVALNLLVGSFMLKEKLISEEDIPLLTARDIMEFLVFRFYKEMTEERLLNALQERHRKRLKDIDYCYSD